MPHFLRNPAVLTNSSHGHRRCIRRLIPVDSRLCRSRREQAKAGAVPESYTPDSKIKMETRSMAARVFGGGFLCRAFDVVLAVIVLGE